MIDLNWLTVPGWTGSGPDHWMSLWEREDRAWQRVEQADWDDPRPEKWIDALDRRVASAPKPVVLLAHSCGVATVTRWAVAPEARVVCGILVAPPDTELAAAPDQVRRFGPARSEAMPFPTLVIASRNDPYCSWERVQRFAELWGSELFDAGEAGHLNTSSGHGPWIAGRTVVTAFAERQRLRDA